MDITTSLGFLKSSLSGVVFLGWPVIALVYPLFASFMAVSNDSKDQMRKLVMYWTLFSLFSLFEFAFVKITEWIPYWSSVRLVVIGCLVMPQFEGASLAYQGLARTVLLVKRLCKRETVLNVVENNIEENGSDALESRIALEHESQKRIEQEGESSSATSKQVLNGTCAITNDKEMAPPKASAGNRRPETTPLEKTQQDEQSISSAQVLNGTCAITSDKEVTPPKASAENRRPETTPLKKTQEEWPCVLCKVTFVSRSMLNAHLQGSKHKSLKASMCDAIDTVPSPSVQHAQSVSVAQDLTGTFAAAEFKDIMPSNDTAEKRRPETPLLKKAQQEWTTKSEITFNHLEGRKHMSKLGAKDKGPSPSATIKLKDGNVAEKLIKDSGSEGKLIASKTGLGECNNSHGDVQVVESQQYANAVVKETTPPKDQHEWRRDLYKVRGTGEEMLSACLRGSEDRSKFESLKTSNLVGTGIKDGAFPKRCTVCDVKLLSNANVATHLKGKKHISNLKLSQKNGETGSYDMIPETETCRRW